MVDAKVTYDSVVAAKYLLATAYSKNKVLNVTKVQKLLYMAYGYFLSKKNRVLLTEKPKAWPYGPVFPRTRKKVNYSDIIDMDLEEFAEIKSDIEVNDFFNLLVDKYSKYSASQLSEWSHAEGGAWDMTVKQNGFDWNQPIADEHIIEYFKKIDF
ncbi:type II toxin-antitoxin system antitoxin SocA domain-containing protein [Marivirga tractuosa]|uniref:Panacea domain-containing protein n=1 Tax=Marivirga tractuosa TaxID=1006 RepID=UPI0035CEFCDA